MATDTQNRFIKVNGTYQRPDGRSLFPLAADEVNQGTLESPVIYKNGQPLLGSTSSAPGSDLPEENTPAPTPAPDTSGFDSFNKILTTMLAKAKGVNTTELLKQRRALQRKSADISATATPEELRTLSPSQQNAMRSADQNVVEGQLDENAYELKKAQDAIDAFNDTYTEARKLGEDFADKLEAPDSVIQAYKRAIETVPENMSTILAGANDKTRQKVIASLDYNAIAKKKKSSSSSTTTKVTPSQLSAIEQHLKDTKKDASGYSIRGADGYTDPNVYLEALQDWLDAGYLEKDFILKFPPKNYLNPKNTLPEVRRLLGPIPKSQSGREH